MEDQCSPQSWGFYYQPEEGFEDLKHSLLFTTLELETTILSAYEEIARKDDELLNLKELLSKTIQERDEAQEKYQMLELEKKLLQQQQELEATVLVTVPNKGHSQENVIPPQGIIEPAGQFSPKQPENLVVFNKPLPENGRFLQAVMEAGPLLQTLLLAGPLPQWQHPPPHLHSVEIPPVTISSSPTSTTTPRLLHQDSSVSTSTTDCCFSKKRALIDLPCEASDYNSSPNTKYQKVTVSPFTLLTNS